MGRKSQSPVITNNPSIPQNLEDLYVFRGREEVLDFIKIYPFLANLLLEAYSNIRKYFKDSPLFLRIFTDPETIGESYLLILIGTNYSPEETVKRLDELDEDWWLQALEHTKGKLSINVEFQ